MLFLKNISKSNTFLVLVTKLMQYWPIPKAQSSNPDRTGTQTQAELFPFGSQEMYDSSMWRTRILVDSKNKLPTVIHNEHHVLFEILPTGGKHSRGLL